MHVLRNITIALPLSLALVVPVAAADAAGTPMTVVGQFIAKGDPATDLSGIACNDAQPRLCVVGDDEGRKAQLARLHPDKIEVLKLFDLVPEEEDDLVAIGETPVAHCPNPEPDFGEFDSEGVAFHDNVFFVTGSHGCGRDQGKFKSSSFLVARIDATKTDKVERSFRLNEILSSTRSGLGAHFGKALNAENGISIEGLAAIGGDLFFGLRSPVLEKGAALVKVPAASLFTADAALPEDAFQPIWVKLPAPGLGIRDLAPLGTDLLAIVGPTLAGAEGFSIVRIEPKTDGLVTTLATLPPVMGQDGKQAQAEGLLVLETDPLKVLVLFDGKVVNGNPLVFDLSP